VLAFEFARGMHLRNLFVVLGLFVAALMFADAPAHAHHDRAQDQSSDHDPADHSHPLGEDTYHEKASHSSLDFAHYHVVAVKLSALPRAANLPAVDEAASGLVPTPLLRPPLG
jgi:hypothetical protein